mmetsp:Transcript_125596/g.391036  ORF Transcript_125596/g.391036 Transcript_125596/m.391036 type:complete len:393 (-) Transcript_125596:47-1225(-)
MRSHVVHWGDIAPKLPFGCDSVTLMKRRELFDACDPRGIGLLSQSEVVRYFFRLLPPVAGIIDMKVALNLCFRAARETVTPVVHIGSQQLDRNQFRVFLMNVWYYIKLWERFCTVDESGARDVTPEIFEGLLPVMAEWGFGEVGEWLADPESVYQRLDRGGGGGLSFDELAEFCLKRGVPKLSAPDDEEERRAALDVLSRTQPHLASKVAPAGSGRRSSMPPVPPPGQKLPPSGPSSSTGSSPSAADTKMRRWSSQYTMDYAPPSQRSSRAGSLAVSAVPTPSRTRASTPAGGRRDSLRAFSKESCRTNASGGGRRDSERAVSKESCSTEAEAARDLRRQNSAPSIASSAGGGDLDRGALRSKLEQNMAMYSTSQMRRILEVAGNMVVGPKS